MRYMRRRATWTRLPARVALLALAGCGCGGLRPPGLAPPEPEPAFLWGLCNPASAAEIADLAGGRPFLVRLDSPFTGGRPILRSARELHRLRTDPGVRFMIVLPYRPDRRAGPDEWSAFVERAVEYYARQPAVRYLQITQGINRPAYADLAGDRAPFARQALLDGLRVAHETRARVGADLRLGFSVYVGSGSTPEELLRWLGRDAELSSLVDWVGLDCYPGTGLLTLQGGASDALAGVLRRARDEWLPLAGLQHTPLMLTQLGVSTVLHVSPDALGYWVDTLATTVWRERESLNVRGCCWYEARDKDSSAGVLGGPRRYVESHFGLSTTSGWRKEGFYSYRARIAALQPQTPAGTVVD